MKKTITALLLLSAVNLCTNGQFTHLGIAGGFGTSIKEPGFGLYGMYTVNQQIKFTPNIMVYIPHEITTNDGTQTFTWWIFNMDGNYVAFDRAAYQAYGLMGLSLIYQKGEQDEPPFSDTKYLYILGLNVGAGIRFPITDRVYPFAEAKITLGDKAYYTFREVSTVQLGIKAGVLIRIAPDKENNSEDY